MNCETASSLVRRLIPARFRSPTKVEELLLNDIVPSSAYLTKPVEQTREPVTYQPFEGD
jgi:hypothetical protein